MVCLRIYSGNCMLEFMLVELVYRIASFLAMTVQAIQLMPLEGRFGLAVLQMLSFEFLIKSR